MLRQILTADIKSYIQSPSKESSSSKVRNWFVRNSLKQRPGRRLFLLFPTFVLFSIECFRSTLLPSPWDKLEFLDQMFIKLNVTYLGLAYQGFKILA